jgi:uncharacterized membrane protein (Fun14 family)
VQELRELRLQLAARDAELAAVEADRVAAAKAAAEAPSRFVKNAIGVMVPAGSQIALGGFLGYCSGYTLKLAGRAAAVGVGMSFAMLQALSYLDYVNVNWRAVERDYQKRADRNGDGRVDAEDFALIARDAMDVMAFNLPAGAGFTSGVVYALGGARLAAGGTLLGLGARFAAPRVALAAGAGATTLPAVVVAARRAGGGENAADGTIIAPVEKPCEGEGEGAAEAVSGAAAPRFA